MGGKRTLEKWNSKVDTINRVLETKIDGEYKNFRIIDTGSNHYGIEIENKFAEGESILYTKGNEKELEKYAAIKKVHEVNNHKSADQLVAAYNRAGLMGPGTVKTIRQVVNDCKVCQKFGKSLVKPKIALAKGGSFNEIVTLDLKQFGSRYVLWCIDSFTRFAQGKLIYNKKADTIVNALIECWNLPFGIPSIRYYADNGTEFKNVKMDELVSKLGISINYGPAHSPWLNGINERNHASCDVTIKKLMEDKKIGLTDVLVKTAAWTHNTNVNRAGYSPLTLVTGKAVQIPGLTMKTVASESSTDGEAVRRIMETITKTTIEFREAEMKKKLGECQTIRTRRYQHQGNYIEGDKVWYQFKDTVAWHGPASVICQRGNTVYVHANGEVKKLAACRVKPCELRERKVDEKEEQNKERDEDKWNRWIEEDGKMEEKKVKQRMKMRKMRK